MVATKIITSRAIEGCPTGLACRVHARVWLLQKDEHGEAGELSRIDIRAGMAWLKNAASLGTKEAANQVGDAYMPGQFQEFPKIYGGGLKWQRMAAELGQADAAFKLGVAYCCGAMPYNETQITT